METLPMFPLGLVAYPGSVIPLRLFEPRYLDLLADLQSGDGEFGIVLIERGVAEAGGGEYFGIGSVVRTVASAPLDDGSVMLVVVGTERIRVVDWLVDDPYPRARIERMPMPENTDMLGSPIEECRRELTKVLALASELGADVGDPRPELSDDPLVALYEMARIAPIQELDQQRILESGDSIEAARILTDELRSVATMLEIQLTDG